MRNLIASDLSDTEVEAEVKRLAGCEREATASLVAHLAELEMRHIHLNAGLPSLFSYCTVVLRLSEAAAYNRIVAARTVRRFPRVLERLVEGSLNLTTVKLLAPHMTDDNCGDLVLEACHRNRREVEELLARRCPRPDTRDSVRKLPAPAPASPPAPLPETGPCFRRLGPSPVPTTEPARGPRSEPRPIAAAAVTPAAKHRPPVTALGLDRYQFTFTGDGETRDMLELARDLLRHAVPRGDTAAIMKRALKSLLDDLARTRFAATNRPGNGATSPARSRHVPAKVKRAVWARDHGCCAFVGESGRRCRERGYLEFHHVTPFARGGPTTADNLQLRCRTHNAFQAERDFGERRPRGEWDVARMAAVSVGEALAAGATVAGTTRPGTSAGGGGARGAAGRQPTVPSAQTASGP